MKQETTALRRLRQEEDCDEFKVSLSSKVKFCFKNWRKEGWLSPINFKLSPKSSYRLVILPKNARLGFHCFTVLLWLIKQTAFKCRAQVRKVTVVQIKGCRLRRWDPRSGSSAVQTPPHPPLLWHEWMKLWHESGPRLQQDLEEDSLGSPSDLISSQWPPETCSMHWLMATANKGPLGVLVPKPTWRETILLKIRSWIQHIFTASLTSTANTTRPLGQDGLLSLQTFSKWQTIH